MENADNRAIVVDNGSGIVKAGFAGDPGPSIELPNIVGRPRESSIMYGMTKLKNIFVGREAQTKRGILTLRYPIEHGIVRDWEDMERVWEYTFKELAVAPENHRVMLTEPPLNPKKERERMIEMMFDAFNVQAAFLADQGMLSLFSTGRTTAVVVDIGNGVSHTVPIIEGYIVSSAINRFNFAGRDITDILVKLLMERGYYSFTTSAEREIVRNMKEKLAYVAKNYEMELMKSTSIEKNYELPDGQVITIGDERFRCAEVLFQPSLIGLMEASGIHDMIFSSIMRCKIEERKSLYNNIILAGGSTTLPGMAARLRREINYLVPQEMRNEVKVLSQAGRKYSVWKGGSCIAEQDSFQQMWITRQQFLEAGSSIVHNRCSFLRTL